jgi:hypothetical protein
VVGRDGKALPRQSAVAGLRESKAGSGPTRNVSNVRIQALDCRQ